MPDNIIKSNASFSWFQNLDGSRFAMGGVEENVVSKRGSAGVFIGAGTDFETDAKAILDFKGSYKYDQNGRMNQNLRVRNTVGLKSAKTEIRYSPLSLNIPVTDKTSFYANPHYNGSIDYKKGKWSNSAGVFAGITQKISKNATLSVEAQRYNLQDIKDNSGKNWGVNAIISWDL